MFDELLMMLPTPVEPNGVGVPSTMPLGPPSVYACAPARNVMPLKLVPAAMSLVSDSVLEDAKNSESPATGRYAPPLVQLAELFHALLVGAADQVALAACAMLCAHAIVAAADAASNTFRRTFVRRV